MSKLGLIIHRIAHAHRLKHQKGVEKEAARAQRKVETAYTVYRQLIKLLDDRKPLLDTFSKAVLAADQAKADRKAAKIRTLKDIEDPALKEATQALATSFVKEDDLVKEIKSFLNQVDEHNFTIVMEAVKTPEFLLRSTLPAIRELVAKHPDKALKPIIDDIKSKIENGYLRMLDRIIQNFHHIARRNLRAVYRGKASLSNVSILREKDLMLHERRTWHDERQLSEKGENIQRNIEEVMKTIRTTLKEDHPEVKLLVDTLQAYHDNLVLLLRYILAEVMMANKVLKYNAIFTRKLELMVEKRQKALEGLKTPRNVKSLVAKYIKDVEALNRSLKKSGRMIYREAKFVRRYQLRRAGKVATIVVALGLLSSACGRIGDTTKSAFREGIVEEAGEVITDVIGGVNPLKREIERSVNKVIPDLNSLFLAYQSSTQNEFGKLKTEMETTIKDETDAIKKEAEKFVDKCTTNFMATANTTQRIHNFRNWLPGKLKVKDADEQATFNSIVASSTPDLHLWMKWRIIDLMREKVNNMKDSDTKAHLLLVLEQREKNFGGVDLTIKGTLDQIYKVHNLFLEHNIPASSKLKTRSEIEKQFRLFLNQRKVQRKRYKVRYSRQRKQIIEQMQALGLKYDLNRKGDFEIFLKKRVKVDGKSYKVDGFTFETAAYIIEVRNTPQKGGTKEGSRVEQVIVSIKDSKEVGRKIIMTKGALLSKEDRKHLGVNKFVIQFTYIDQKDGKEKVIYANENYPGANRTWSYSQNIYDVWRSTLFETLEEYEDWLGRGLIEMRQIIALTNAKINS